MTPAGPVRVAILGAGVRGTEHARRVRTGGGIVAAIAEPDEQRRQRLAAEHDVPADACFRDWRELAEHAADRVDAVLIATQDTEHADPCVRFAELGKHIISEKPMAPTESDAVRMVSAVERAGVIFDKDVAPSCAFHAGSSKYGCGRIEVSVYLGNLTLQYQGEGTYPAKFQVNGKVTTFSSARYDAQAAFEDTTIKAQLVNAMLAKLPPS